MHDKIVLLMEETGCDRGEAELALEMCGYEVEAAVKAIPRLLKNIVVLKGKFVHPEANQFGLLLVVLNTKSGTLLRSRAVLSFNPAVYAVSLDRDWFEFEKTLYACRLWDGSLQAESLEIEQSLAGHYRQASPEELERVATGEVAAARASVGGVLTELLGGPALTLKLTRDILDLGQFQSLRNDPDGGARKGARGARPVPHADELLVLKIKLQEDPGGIAAGGLRAGDMVSARIADARDIAQYLAKLFGGHSEKGPVPILAPVEAIEAIPGAGMLVRVRFSVGVCGDAEVPRDGRLKAVRIAVRNQERLSWWRRLFNS